MSLFRSLTASLLSGAVTFSVVTASGCGTSAIGIEDCRSIEEARCRGALPCGLVDDVAACERYYRDHCLHGLLQKPSAGEVAECVEVIDNAGRCASVDPETKLPECDPWVTEQAPGLGSACDVVAHPERARECSFLLDRPFDDGSGGQPATAGAPAQEPTAGAAGQTAAGGAPAE